jgi:hypothetical protein
MVTELAVHPTSAMVSGSKSSSSTTIPSFNISVTEKLTKSNYLLWQAQIMSAICPAQLEGLRWL